MRTGHVHVLLKKSVATSIVPSLGARPKTLSSTSFKVADWSFGTCTHGRPYKWISASLSSVLHQHYKGCPDLAHMGIRDLPMRILFLPCYALRGSRMIPNSYLIPAERH